LTAGGAIQVENGQRVDTYCEVHLWNLEPLQHLAAWAGHTRFVRDVAFAEGGRAVSSGDDGIRIWEVTRGKEIKHVATGTRVGGVCSANGRFVVVRVPGKLQLWDVAEGRELKHLAFVNDHAHDVAFAGEGRLVAVYGAFLPRPPGTPTTVRPEPDPA